jgi:hypothetical protein
MGQGKLDDESIRGEEYEDFLTSYYLQTSTYTHTYIHTHTVTHTHTYAQDATRESVPYILEGKHNIPSIRPSLNTVEKGMEKEPMYRLSILSDDSPSSSPPSAISSSIISSKRVNTISSCTYNIQSRAITWLCKMK